MPDEPRDPFQLSGLPQPQAPSDPWPAIAAALQRSRRRRIGAWATAAAVTLALGLSWQLQQDHPAPGPEPDPGAILIAAETAGNAERDVRAGPTPAAAGTLAALVELSQQLETRLRRLRAEAGAVPGESLIYQVELEDLVAQVDEAINRQPDSHALWSQRVNLLLDLNRLYQRELRREYGQVASL